MNSVLIIGASGLLGRTLVKKFINKARIGVLCRNPKKYKINTIRTYSIDVLEAVPLDAIIREYDTIINCVGQITSPISNCLTLNTVGVKNIVDSVKKYNKELIHISTVSVYGSANYVDEDSKLNPETPYGSIKCFSEYLIKSNIKKYTILRVSNLYGSSQKKGIIGYLTNSYLSDENEINFNNDGSLKRYYLHIDDLSNVIVQIYMKDISGVYNIIGQDFLTIKGIILMFESVLDYKFDVTYDDIKPIENIKVIDNSKLENLLSIGNKTSVKSYIKDIYNYKRTNIFTNEES
jgi:nucleoside-diphosphate-sugar epimerase